MNRAIRQTCRRYRRRQPFLVQQYLSRSPVESCRNPVETGKEPLQRSVQSASRLAVFDGVDKVRQITRIGKKYVAGKIGGLRHAYRRIASEGPFTECCDSAECFAQCGHLRVQIGIFSLRQRGLLRAQSIAVQLAWLLSPADIHDRMAMLKAVIEAHVRGSLSCDCRIFN